MDEFNRGVYDYIIATDESHTADISRILGNRSHFPVPVL